MKVRSLRDLRNTLGIAAILLTLALAVPFSALAQTFRGGINGTVTDSSGAVVAGAEVNAVETATNVSHKSITSSAGEYSFQELPLGAYSVTVSASGFTSEKVNMVPVTAGVIYTLPVKLTVASAGMQTVEVSAAAYALDTTTTTQTTIIDAKTVADIPLNGRDFTQLVTLTPGFSDSGAGGYGSLNGTRANQINWQIDGVDNNDIWHNIPAVNQGGVSGIAGIVLPIDAVEQFSAQTMASPETGRNPGGTVSLALKSGTNQLHGTAYYFNRNEALGAKNPFSDTKEKVRNYNYGFSVGGPFLKDKLFGFVTFEHQRFEIGVPQRSTEPSTAWQSLASDVLAANGKSVNPVSTALLTTLYPSYALSSPFGVNNYTSPDPEFGYSYNGVAKIDYTINEKNSLSFHYFAGQGNQVAPVGSTLLAYYEVAPIHVYNYQLTYNHVFSPSMTNQVNAGVNYFNQVFYDNQNSFDVASTGFITGSAFTDAPNLKIANFDPTGETPPEGRNDITGQIADNLSWVKGKHEMKMGGEYRKVQLNEFYHRKAQGSFTFNGVGSNGEDLYSLAGLDDADTQLVSDPAVASRAKSLAAFLEGQINSGSITVGDPERLVYINTLAFFAQDSYQISPKFNVNYGIRWDYEGPLHDSKKDLSVFRPSIGGTGIAFQGDQTDSVYDPKYTNFSPRVGFSYQALRNTVLRGGVGLYYDTPNLNPFLDNRPGNNAPNGVEGNPAGANPVQTLAKSYYQIQSGVNPFSAATCSPDTPCGVFSVQKGFRPSTNLEYNLQLEQSLSPKVIAQLGFVGSQGRHQLSIVDLNQGYLDLTGEKTLQETRPYYSMFPDYGNINEIQSTGDANYAALQATLRASNLKGFSAQVAYTWSHTFDDVTAYRGALPQNSFNPKGDYGQSDFDERNIFVGAVDYNAPSAHFLPAITGGWEASAKFSFHSGNPFSVFTDDQTDGTQEGVQRANQISNPYAGAKQATVGGNWLNADAFVDPDPGSFGTSKRNAYVAPGYGDIDLSVFKNTKIGEHVNTQLRFEMFNLFNRINFAPPLGGGSGGFNPNYATISSLQLYDTIGDFNGAPGIGAGEPFNMQVGLKIIF
jgi:hypothetical protein